MHHLCPCSRRHPSLSRRFAACQALVRFFALHRIKPHAPPLVRAPVNSFEFHSCERTPQAGYLTRLLGYLIPFATLAFVSQCQCRPSRVLSPLVFFPISTHFTAPPEIPSAPTVLKLEALHPIILDNACILCINATAGTELADAIPQIPSLLLLWEKNSLGRVSVPVWLIILSDQLLILALVSYCLTN
ncbi:unnamed protein product [Brassica oleracea]